MNLFHLAMKVYTPVSKLLLVGRDAWGRMRSFPSQRTLARIKGGQKETFLRLSQGFGALYHDLQQHDIRRFVTSHWEKYNRSLESVFLPVPPFSFLRDPIIMYTMFSVSGRAWATRKLAVIRNRFGKRALTTLLEEDYIGDPLIVHSEYLTTYNSIDHLYHLVRFEKRTKHDPSAFRHVVEWGGGYGNMAKLFRRMSSNATYVIIDTPLFNCLQWLYLSTIFGESAIHVIRNKSDSIRRGKINILPLAFLSSYKGRADLFLSTWALCESSKFSMDYVARRRWFAAKHLLLAYQKSDERLSDADYVGTLAKKDNATIVPVDFQPDNYYAFKYTNI